MREGGKGSAAWPLRRPSLCSLLLGARPFGRLGRFRGLAALAAWQLPFFMDDVTLEAVPWHRRPGGERDEPGRALVGFSDWRDADAVHRIA